MTSWTLNLNREGNREDLGSFFFDSSRRGGDTINIVVVVSVLAFLASEYMFIKLVLYAWLCIMQVSFS